MAQVRALTTIFHQGFLYKAGDLFEMAEDAAKGLTNGLVDGIEAVTKKTTAAFEKVQNAARQELVDKATALRKAYEDLRAELEANPADGGLVQRVLDAEQVAHDAEQEVVKFAENLL